MKKLPFGSTGLDVSALGIGGAEIGMTGRTETQASELLNLALDLGINFVDTAAGYGDGENLTGRAISNRRNEYILASKCSPGTAEEIEESIDRSLRLLRTDVVDIMQLHGGTADYLNVGDGISALQKARDAGKIRFLGYSGDRSDAIEAIRTGAFDTLQTSFNVAEHDTEVMSVLDAANDAGMGVIAKRPLANAVLGADENPLKGTRWENYTQLYWETCQNLNVPDGAPTNHIELALRFTLSERRVHVAIAGTTNPQHLRENVDYASAGPLSAEIVRSIVSGSQAS